MKHFRRYKNAKVETLCQMEVIQPPKPFTPEYPEFLRWMAQQSANMDMQFGAGMAQSQFLGQLGPYTGPDFLDELISNLGRNTGGRIQ